jgi:hypothetical protein
MQKNLKTLESLRNKTLTSDEKAEVQSMLFADPELCQRYTSLDDLTRDEALSIIHPDSLQYQCSTFEINQMRSQLLARGDSPEERILTEQILTTHIQTAKSGYRLETIEPSQETQPSSKHWIRTHHLAQSRLLKSTLALERLRKLKLDNEIKDRKNRPLGFRSSPVEEAPRLTDDEA